MNGGDETARGRREQVLGAVRGRLGLGAGARGRSAAVAGRLAAQPAHLIPERARLDAQRLKALFAAQLRTAFATVVEVAGPADVPAAVTGYLRGANLPLSVRSGDDPWLAGLDWSREPSLTICRGRASPSDEVGLARAVAGVAETGTLVLASGPDNPVTVNFLPETSIVIVRASDLVGPYEAAFDRLRGASGRGAMPRTLNLISGPSRTADVGGRLVTGAHGPRRLCVVIVAGA
jgi:L-lactate dehydrogenase complex protein LldG